MSDDDDARVPILKHPAESTPHVTFKDPSEADLQGNNAVRRRSSVWAPTTAQEKRKKQGYSLINATSFPLLMAIFVTVVKNGNSFTFYETLLPLAITGMLLQLTIAVAVVCEDSVTHNQDNMAPDLEAAAIKKGKRVHKSTFDIWIQILTVISLVNNLAVNAFFSARKMKD